MRIIRASVLVMNYPHLEIEGMPAVITSPLHWMQAVDFLSYITSDRPQPLGGCVPQIFSFVPGLCLR